ncbi:methylamine dehydrogenase [Candidatus Methylacidiphilum fumarolicum]|uniref:Methylamine dehydrogenase small subunit n=2 Tax=Candidatus Methylacidiphilum fumarolicum TaxID=591154 RepID=I0JZ86_METFB|nr:methylamine dehydrogenase light chain [Candidatus Methylacidiphilum fumarolicum]TFE70152.1 methylamine dehydrogenase [Candidatus Methylacidiphilum fumarolicum]TFE75939.1 methylamine dehydrogenase [Candidatus Methylacidiphilum fumarolicum]CAI9084744.1 Aralkylamine dehydrogenase light chain [Candidatus Methylacidiphilum fumarolicum]CCG92555.1 Methylamine dehydrogenase small subunit [Methylacidiphilum fumariolicum SolV]
MNWIDRLVEFWSRRLALRGSRRGFLTSLALFLGAACKLLPAPIERTQSQSTAPEEKELTEKTNNESSCAYWRYCSIDGFLCSCCGGGVTACPPGTFPSPTHWVGSCRNPLDGKQYLISYRDCCGKGACGRCYCQQTNETEMPVYQINRNNDTIWCFGAPNMMYHCTGASILGLAQDFHKE